jgi:trans-aconitate methyltransferase
MPTLNEQPRKRVLLATTDIPAAYHADRLRWWTINSPSWSAHIDADHNRGELLAKLAWRASELMIESESPVVADLGCGEGAFLRAFSRLAPGTNLQGIDFCPEMLAEARSRSGGLKVTYALGDLEEQDFEPACNANLVTSILAMDEMDRLEPAFSNIAKTLAPGAVAMLVVMDPANEMERNRQDLEVSLKGDMRPDHAILLVKTFPRADLEPAAPYSRIVRPLAQYTEAAVAAGLRPEAVEQWSHTVGIGSYSGTLLFDVLVFRKG